MSLSEVVSAAKTAGFAGDDLVLICAIAGRESNWDSAATNNTAMPELSGYHELTDEARSRGIVPEYSVGAWQINLLVHNLPEAQARDYQQAARYAHFLAYQTSQGFRHWSTWRGVVEDGIDSEHFRAVREEIARQSGESGEPSADGIVTYRVQPGDTLWTLAERYLGDPTRWPEIQAANGLPDTIIRVGQTLTIDTREDAPDPTPEPSPEPSPEPLPTVPPAPTYAERAAVIKAELDAANADLGVAFGMINEPARRLMTAFAEAAKLAEEIKNG